MNTVVAMLGNKVSINLDNIKASGVVHQLNVSYYNTTVKIKVGGFGSIETAMNNVSIDVDSLEYKLGQTVNVSLWDDKNGFPIFHESVDCHYYFAGYTKNPETVKIYSPDKGTKIVPKYKIRPIVNCDGEIEYYHIGMKTNRFEYHPNMKISVKEPHMRNRIRVSVVGITFCEHRGLIVVADNGRTYTAKSVYVQHGEHKRFQGWRTRY